MFRASDFVIDSSFEFRPSNFGNTSSQRNSMSPYLAEFLGTAILIIFVEAAVATVVLSNILAPLPPPISRPTQDPAANLAVFAPAPTIRTHANAFFCETVGTLLPAPPISLMVSPTPSYTAGIPTKLDMPLGLGALGALPV